MSINSKQLRNLIDETLLTIAPQLALAAWDSVEVRELLMMTAAQESHCGKYLQQVGCGVALGVFQMEPATYRDLFDNFLIYKRELKECLDENFMVHKDNFKVNLMGNIPYQIVIARLQYYRFSESIPNRTHYIDIHEFILAMARYYKKYWNTAKGKATIAEVLFNYDKYAS